MSLPQNFAERLLALERCVTQLQRSLQAISDRVIPQSAEGSEDDVHVQERRLALLGPNMQTTSGQEDHYGPALASDPRDILSAMNVRLDSVIDEVDQKANKSEAVTKPEFKSVLLGFSAAIGRRFKRYYHENIDDSIVILRAWADSKFEVADEEISNLRDTLWNLNTRIEMALQLMQATTVATKSEVQELRRDMQGKAAASETCTKAELLAAVTALSVTTGRPSDSMAVGMIGAQHQGSLGPQPLEQTAASSSVTQVEPAVWSHGEPLGHPRPQYLKRRRRRGPA